MPAQGFVTKACSRTDGTGKHTETCSDLQHWFGQQANDSLGWLTRERWKENPILFQQQRKAVGPAVCLYCFSSSLGGLFFLNTHPACLSMGCGCSGCSQELAWSVSSTSPWGGKAKKKKSQNKEQLWHRSVKVNTKWLPMEGQSPLPLGSSP